MDLGCFSVSLAVKDLEASRAFYEKLGFNKFGGDADHGYLIMQNGQTNIGLFQGMFEGNILTFNPGWDQSAEEVNPFTNVHEIQAALKAHGVEFEAEAAPASEGPGHFIIKDPDGNMIMVDQHR